MARTTSALRVALFTHTFPGFTETFIANQVAGLLDRGIDVTVIALGSTMPPGTSHPLIDKYRLTERARYLGQLPSSGPARIGHFLRTYALSYRRPVDQVLRGLNVFKYGKAAWSLRLPTYALKLHEMNTRFDAILCHYGPWGLQAQQLREIGAFQGPIGVVFHGYDLTNLLEESGPNLYAPLFRDQALLLPISEFFRRRLLAIGARREQVKVHHMGVNVDELSFTERVFPGEGETLRFISVGRLEEKKGFAYAIRALSRASSSLPPFRYDILGDGSLRDSLGVLIRKLGLHDRVHLHGWQRQDQVARWLREAHVMLAPSVTASNGDMEGIPVVLMEALASGLPAVSTRHSGIPELVKDGETGFLANERDVDDLADTLVRVVADTDRLRQVSTAGRAHVEAEFNIQRLNDDLSSTLHDLANTPWR